MVLALLKISFQCRSTFNTKMVISKSVKQVFLHLLLEKVPIYLLAYEIRKNTFSNLYIKNENRSTFDFFLSYLYLTVVLKDTVSTNFSLYVLKAYSAI